MAAAVVAGLLPVADWVAVDLTFDSSAAVAERATFADADVDGSRQVVGCEWYRRNEEAPKSESQNSNKQGLVKRHSSDYPTM